MSLTKSKGNMYSWLTHTWNPVKGRCQFECPYCYVKSRKGSALDRWYGVPCYLEEKELTTNLGKDRMIFVGSMGDMWGPWVEYEWIQRVLGTCTQSPNIYIFQSKNPARFSEFLPWLKTIDIYLGTTIETDEYPKGFKTKAPSILERFKAMRDLHWSRKFVTIEPIMEFNLIYLVAIIKYIQPEFVTIGADSKGHNLAEPSWEEVQELIDAISKFTEIRQKTNLDRLKKT